MLCKRVSNSGAASKDWEDSDACRDFLSFHKWIIRSTWKIYRYRRNWGTVVFLLQSARRNSTSRLYVKLESPITDAEARWLFLTNAHPSVAPTALQLLNDPNPLLPTLAAEIGSLADDTKPENTTLGS